MLPPKLLAAAAGAATLAFAAVASGHYDHPAPTYAEPAPLSTVVNAGGENADWELVTSIPTGNPHSDLDVFESKGETYASVGTLGVGPNAGGQTIVRLTEDGEVAPSYVTGHPSAACPSLISGATALQHDVEATPKGDVIQNTPNPYAVRSDAQLLIDSTDGSGRCHDNGTLGQSAPHGGLEIIDITNPAAPKELALTSHIGNAHTVNVDPKRPHIAFDVTQDGVSVGPDGKRSNETSGDRLDGFELIDFKSCMDFPAGTPAAVKRERCRPQVYRFRYADAAWATSHTFPNNLQSCHEVEIYPDDRLACASINATLLFDLSGAFDNNGTPHDFSDDKPRGTPLPCKVRPSTTVGAFGTGAPVVDCVNGEVNGQPQPLRVSEWLKIGAPSLQGVKYLGTVRHMGFGATADLVNTRYDATQDIVAAHESEITESGRFVITSDERGGGVVPGGASCTPGADNVRGNGGLHFFPVHKFSKDAPKDAETAQQAYAKTSAGERAIWRARVRTAPQGAFCTAHVFQQIPGQNRIFMGWYSQGTQVLDFTENPDGTVDFREAGWLTPENANTWVSAIFKVQRNADGTFTYWGVTGDGILPGTGRGAIDIYKVTLPAPPTPLGRSAARTYPVSDVKGQPKGGAAAGQPCARSSAFESAQARVTRSGALRLSHSGSRRAARIDLLRVTPTGERVVRRELRRTLSARRLRSGEYVVRFTARAPDGSRDTRRVAVRVRGGRFRRSVTMESRSACGFVQALAVRRPVFGGRRAAPLQVRFRLGEPAHVRVELRRGGKVVERTRRKAYAAGRTHVVRFSARGLRRGTYRVTLRAERPGRTSTASVGARRL